MVGNGEWGEDKSSVCAREKRLEERLKTWEKCDKLPLIERSLTLVLNLSILGSHHQQVVYCGCT